MMCIVIEVFSYKKLSIYFAELQDNNLKTFDAAPGAGRRVVTETL